MDDYEDLESQMLIGVKDLAEGVVTADGEVSVGLLAKIKPSHRFYTDEEGIKHGYLMIAAFFCILQLSVLLQRHMKPWKYSSFIHGLLGIASLILSHYSFCEFYLKFNLPNKVLLPHTIHHSRTGFTLCALISAQVLLGILTKVLILHTKSVRLLLMTRKIHHLTGWILLITGLINVYLGFKIKHPLMLDKLIYPLYGALAFVFLLLEIRRRKTSITIQPNTIRTVTESGLTFELSKENFTYYEVIKKVHKKDKKWVFFNGFVLDISGFISSHPGGSYMLNGVLGEDVSKYLYGIVNYIRDIQPHTHSKHALNIYKKFVFAQVDLPPGIFLNRSGGPVPLKHSWKVTQNYLISEKIHSIELTSEELEINSNPHGWEWMGFHFSVKNSKGVRRYYSLVMADLKKWSLEVKQSGLPSRLAHYGDFSEETQGNLRLYIKKYPEGQVSKMICESEIGSCLSLKGPFGPGLGIYKLPKGDCIAFAAGTGVLVFLDLVYSIWKESAHEQFFLSLYVSFKSRKESIAIDLLEATQKKFRHQFRLQINLDEEAIGGRLTLRMMEGWLNNDIKKIWVCGPCGFNRWVESALSDYGFDKNIITIL